MMRAGVHRRLAALKAVIQSVTGTVLEKIFGTENSLRQGLQEAERVAGCLPRPDAVPKLKQIFRKDWLEITRG